MTSIYQALHELELNFKTATLCTVVKTSGSTPRHSTSKMIVYPDGSLIGTVGGGGLENQVIEEALISQKNGLARLLEYQMTDPERGDVGICGGQVMIYIEPIHPAPMVVVIGGGHVGKAVAHLAKWLGYRTAISDDRPLFCTPEANPDADFFLPVEMKDIPANLEIDEHTYLVLTTRGVSVDKDGLPSLIKTRAGYIGVIGSRKRWAETVKHLKSLGISSEEISKIHAPIGLEIHAETPEEIAVSIMAELVAINRQRSKTGKKNNSSE